MKSHEYISNAVF